jgi:5-methyltetrahydrofolate--homocysteine methyltransferase
MEEHADYAIDFIKAQEDHQEECPYVKISGGISNLVLGFRGVNKIVNRSTPYSSNIS